MTQVSEPGKGPLLQAAEEFLPLDPVDIEAQAKFGPMFTRDDAEPEEQLSEEELAERQIATDLDERAREDFVGLMFLGRLEQSCVVAQHRFLLRTPTHNERIERANLHREFLGSMNTEPMWRLITVATYCVEVDDVAAPTPLNTRTGAVTDRLRWIKDTIYSSVVIEKLFMECLRLDARERAVVEHVDGQTKS